MQNKKLKIIFAGTPEFSVPTLKLLHDSGYEISLVMTQPDRKSGRGMKINPSPVKKYAIENKLPLYQPEKLSKNKDLENKILSLNPDVLIVVAYGLIMPTDFLNYFKHKYNIHASLLPRWRGAAPIHRAIEAGDKETGITIMRVIPELDAGPIIIKENVVIKDSDTTGDLNIKLSEIGAKLMLKVITKIKEGNIINAVNQNDADASYAHKVKKTESLLNKNDSAHIVCRKIRAFNPYPVVHCFFREKIIKIWEADIVSIKIDSIVNLLPGNFLIVKENLYLQLHDEAIKIIKIQPEGSRSMTAKEFIHGYSVVTGESIT
jgi:methionyl-tRNA formyltransferase|tara:strand:+ start:88 stop:1044 length:957 start_codon:yes stop_codon:yes gene_type:complete